MGDPRPEKVAVVDEVRAKFADSDGALLTEYRGLNVPAMAELRGALREAGGEYKIYKNTLVRLAAKDHGLEIDDLLIGPTAIAFVGEKADGSPGDAAAVAKALKDFAKRHQALVLKGGVLDNKLLSADDLKALAELPSRDAMLAQIAGAFQAPMAKLAGLLSALPRDFAYGLQALIDKGGSGDAPAVEEAATEAATEEAPAEEPAEASDDADAEETPAEASAEASDEEPAEASDDADAEETPAEASAEASDEEPTEASNDADAGDETEEEA